MSNERWGTDLSLLTDLVNQSDRNKGEDLKIQKRPETNNFDLATYSQAENLSQALLMRFLTPMGELAVLGHPTYGSRLYELVGERNVQRTHNRAKMFVLQALADEVRVAQVLKITVQQNQRDRTRMDINISLKTIHSDTPLNLVFPFFLA